MYKHGYEKEHKNGRVRNSEYDPNGINYGTYDAVKIRQVCLWMKHD